MSSKINICNILRDHCGTLVNNSGRSSRIDYATFFLIPMIVFLTVYLKQIKLESSTVEMLITSFSIFCGLLINVLVLIYSLGERFRGDNAVSATKYADEKRFLREIFSNISYANFICILIIFILVIYSLFDLPWHTTFSATVLMLAANFILTLLMVLKRIHNMLGIIFR